MRTLKGLAEELLTGLALAQERALQVSSREGAITALGALHQFVMGASERLPDPRSQFDMIGRKAVIDELAMALIELPDGIVSPILTPGAKYNRSPLGRHILLARGTAAAATEILVRSGERVEGAAKRVAHHIAGRPELAGIERSPWKAVQRWRNDILKAEDRPTFDDFRHDHRAPLDIAKFDEILWWHDQLIAEGKGSAEQSKAFAMHWLDVGRPLHSRKAPA